jgi:hypothetical protein
LLIKLEIASIETPACYLRPRQVPLGNQLMMICLPFSLSYYFIDHEG